MSTIALVFMTVTQTLNLPDGLLSSICYVESNHKIDIDHKDDGNGDSIGICQIKHETAKLLGYKGTEKDLYNLKTNVYWAGMYLAKQLKRYDNDSSMAVSAYNAGTCRINPKGLIMNRKYVTKVFEVWSRTTEAEFDIYRDTYPPRKLIIQAER